MHNINLLPRRSASEKLLVYWITLVISVGLVLLVSQIVLSAMMNDGQSRMETEIKFLDAKISEQNTKLTPDQATRLFDQFTGEAQIIIAAKKDWLIHLQTIASYLPDHTSIVNMDVDSSGKYHAEMHFATQEHFLVFMNRLQADPAFAHIQVSDLTFQMPSIPSGTPTGSGVDLSESPNPNKTMNEEWLEQMVPGYSSNASKELQQLLQLSDDLLQDFSWEGSALLSEGSPFTFEELIEMASRMNSEADTEPPSPLIEDLKLPIDYYRVILDIQFVAIGKAGS